MWWANRFLLAVGCCFFCQRKNIPWLNFVFRVCFVFFCSCLLRASRSGKIKVVARTDDFSAGAGLTRRKYLALKKFSFTDPRVLLVFFVVV